MGDQVRAWAFDFVGLLFACVAAYGLATGRLTPEAQQTALTVAALYLGIRVPNGVVADGTVTTTTTAVTAAPHVPTITNP